MIDYLSQVKPLEDVGKTDDQIARHLSQLTARPVLCADAKIAMEEAGVVIEDPITGQRSGPLVDFYQSMAAGPKKQRLGWFVTHVFGRGQSIASDTQPRASQVVDAIAELPGPMKAVGEAILKLGGGQPYENATGGDVAVARAAWQTQQNRDQLRTDYDAAYNEHVAPVLDSESPTLPSLLNGIQAMSDALEAD